jgi:hypothetical protein
LLRLPGNGGPRKHVFSEHYGKRKYGDCCFRPNTVLNRRNAALQTTSRLILFLNAGLSDIRSADKGLPTDTFH